MVKASLIWISLMWWSSSFAQDGEWKNLFNGHDLTGWELKYGQAPYKVVNNAIVGKSVMNSPNSFLCTKNEYGDFILELEVYIDAALNSGIQIRSVQDIKQQGRVIGYQVEIDPSARAYSGGIYDEGRRDWLCTLADHEAGRKAFVNGGWNKYHIEAIGPDIRVWVNGINTANLVDDLTKRGLIALQVHNIGQDKEKEGLEVKWRNIRIKTDNLEKDRWNIHPQVNEVVLLPNYITISEQRKGWRLLWDGKTNTGWRSAKTMDFPAKGWVIDQGILKVIKSGGGESTFGGDIITRESFSNFELSLEFKLSEGGNSGIKYFVDPELNKGEGSAIGFEYQLLDDKTHADAKAGVNGNRTLASLYDLIPAANLSVSGRGILFRGIGQWNQARIVVRGNKIEHWLNGYKVVEYERRTQMFRALVANSKYKIWPLFGEADAGHILLQDHGDEVSFRSIKIREL